jgi:formylmethanofuran dehydrogenase subunit E
MNETMTREFEALLEESVRVHGHLCAGQVLGVRMSMLGLDQVGIRDPRGADRKNLIVFVEMDRCATDAVQSVSGVSLGKRSMKFMDFGKMAATFLNLATGQAVRVLALEEARDRAKAYFPDVPDKYAAQLEAYKVMPPDELFSVAEVDVELRPEDMPGRPLSRVVCAQCGEHVQDRREVVKHGRTLCRACAGGAYYTPKPGLVPPGVMHNCHSAPSRASLGVRSKLWIEVDGEPVFGRGRMMLLRAIGTHGSINQAAREINISYRKAWGYIKAMEERLGLRLVDCQTGGKGGGGASLTPEAAEFVRKYAALEDGVKAAVDERFSAVFPPGAENQK